MASVKEEPESPALEIRPMHELDVPVVVAIERSAYQFPWSEGIFRDCLRVGYICRLAEVDGEIAGYGIMSIGAGEAHILNVCVRDECRGRGFAHFTGLEHERRGYRALCRGLENSLSTRASSEITSGLGEGYEF